MKVFLAKYDWHKGDEDFALFFTEAAAIDQVIAWCSDRKLLNGDVTDQIARQLLLKDGRVGFSLEEIYFDVTEMEVEGEQVTAVPASLHIEPLVALSTRHVSPETLDWMANGGQGAIFYPGEAGGFLYIGAQDAWVGDAVPSEVVAIVVWARAQPEGLVWVKFDPDGGIVEALTVFEH
jgi:hypothetical protein